MPGRMRIFRRRSFTRWWNRPPHQLPSEEPYWGVLSVPDVFLVSDRFDRVDSTTSLDVADTGQTWVPNSGIWGIDTKTAYLVSATGQATVVTDSGQFDCRIQTTVLVAGDVGLCWRSSDDNNNFVWSGASPTGGIYKRVGGSYTSLMSSSSLVILPGDVIRVDVLGDIHTFYKNGVYLGSVTESFNDTATKHGLRSNAVTTARFEDFSVHTP